MLSRPFALAVIQELEKVDGMLRGCAVKAQAALVAVAQVVPLALGGQFHPFAGDDAPGEDISGVLLGGMRL